MISFLTHDLEYGIALSNGMSESSGCTSDTSVQLVCRESVKRLSATPMNSFNHDKTWQDPCIEIIIIIESSIPYLRGSLGYHRWFCNQFPPVLRCPLGLDELQACPFPIVCLSPSFSVRLVFFPPFTVPCKMVLARPDERETCPNHCSLRLAHVKKSCGLTDLCGASIVSLFRVEFFWDVPVYFANISKSLFVVAFW